MSNDLPDKPERGVPSHPQYPDHPETAPPPPAAVPVRAAFPLATTAQDQVGKRLLAAIMFTDVVNFTGRMSQDEEVTLQLVQRDMAWITQQVERHDGRVLKSTGDGLLSCFSSAHEGVNCALAVQDRLDDIARHNPSHRALQHRIAVHVGDVFFMHNDIMGDGVNVTARLLQEAAPNAIILSQTVFELVKGGLSVPLAYLGAKQLKHLPLPMAVYQISPRSTKKSQMINLPPRSSSSSSAGDRPVPVARAVHIPQRGAGSSGIAGSGTFGTGAGTGAGVGSAGAARSGQFVGQTANQQPYQSPTASSRLPEIAPNPRDYGVKLADTQRDEDAEQQRAGAAMGVHMRTEADAPPPLPPLAHLGETEEIEDAGYETSENEGYDTAQQLHEAEHDTHTPMEGHHHHAHAIGIPNPHQPHSRHEDADETVHGAHGHQSHDSRQQRGMHAGDHHSHGQESENRAQRHAGTSAAGGAAWQQIRITSALQQPLQNQNIQKHAEFQQLHFGRLASQAPYRFLFDMICQMMEERGRLLEGRMEEGWIRAMWPHGGDRRAQTRPGEKAPSGPEETRRHPVTGLLKALPKIIKGWSALTGVGGKDGLPVSSTSESYVEMRFFASGFSTLIDIVPDGKHMPEVAPALVMGKRGAAGSEARADARRRSVVHQIAQSLTGEAHPIPPEYFIPEPNAPRPPAYTLRKE